MTTLHVDQDALRAGGRAVPLGRRPARPAPTSRTGCASRSSSASRSPTVETGGSARPGAGGGLLLGGVRADATCPIVHDRGAARRRPASADRAALAALRVAAAAPEELRARAERLCYGPRRA